MNYYWEDNRRFNSWTAYTQRKYGGRLQKVSLNAGFSCPNRDGTIGYGGCTYCNNEAFNPSYCNPSKSITAQLDQGIAFLKRRYKNISGFIAYFQAYTNTYGSVELLEEKYREALVHEDIMGISVGTRPDCINSQVLDLLEDISASKFVSLELGIESCYDSTLKRINRGHTFDQSVRAIKLASERGLHVTAHIIFGLPGETQLQMLNQAKIISALPINSVKFHQLQIVKGTKMAQQYLSYPKQFELFELDEYVDFIVSFTERLAPRMLIDRFCGEVPPKYNLGKKWGEMRYYQILEKIEKKFEQKNTWQGKLFG